MISENKSLFLVFSAIFTISVLAFFIRTLTSSSALYVDAKMYFTITRSIIKDSDLDFTNEFDFFDINAEKNRYGLPVNIQPPGTSLIWLLPYMQTDLLSQTFSGFIYPLKNSGFEMRYQLTLGLYNIFLGITGLFFIYLTLRKFFTYKVSLATLLLIFGATNIFFYTALEPLNSHMPSLFLASLIFYFLSKKKKLMMRDVFFLGILAGLAALVRTQDSVIILFVIFVFLKSKYNFVHWINFLLGFISGFAPQIYFWKTLFDTFWKSPYLDYGINFAKPHILYILFNLHNGFWTTTPIMFFAFLGLIVYLKKNSANPVLLTAYFFLQLIIVASYSMYYQTDSYSIRMLITTYPFLSFGLANIIRLALKKAGLNKVFTAGVFLVLINILLAIKFLSNFRFN